MSSNVFLWRAVVGGSRVLLALAVSIALALTGLQPANAVITATDADVVKIAPPPSVRENALEHDDHILAFDERQGFMLTTALATDISSAGTYDAMTQLTPGIIPAGTVVNSHFFNADPVGVSDPSGNARTYIGSATFDGPILGIQVLSLNLKRSDLLGAPGTTYPPGTAASIGSVLSEYNTRGLELIGNPLSPQGGDVVVSADMTTVSMTMRLHRLDQIRVITAVPPEPTGGQGCTPGYWKQSQHFDSWVTYQPAQKFEVVFGIESYPTSNPTLLQVLNNGSGGIHALGRHAVAALLNARSPGVPYAYTSAQVIALYQAAVSSGSAAKIEATKNLLDRANNGGCRLN